MTIRRKIFTLYLLTSVGALVMLLAGAKMILLDRLSRLEDDEVRLDMDRALAAVAGLQGAVLATARDYGNLDDIRAYLAKPDQAIIKPAFVDAAFQNLKLDLVVLAEPDGRIVYSQGYDRDTKGMRDIPASWFTLFKAYGFFSPEVVQGDPEGRKGLLLTEQGPLMVVVKPVLTGQEKGTPRGVLIMGRLLGREDTEYASRLALLNLRWLPLDQLPVDIGFINQGKPSPAGGVPVAVRPESDTVVEGLCLAKDMMGAPIGVWRIELDRRLYDKGLAGILYFLGVVTAGGVAFMGGFAFILERMVFGRLWRLNSQEDAAVRGQGSGGGSTVTGSRTTEIWAAEGQPTEHRRRGRDPEDGED
jgi:sensor domain CHASE-containing protein